MPIRSEPAAIPAGVPQYFLDDELIDKHHKVVRRWLPATVFPYPTVVPDKPWEDRQLILYGTVLRCKDQWRMYYGSSLPNGGRGVLIAVSDDGFRWQKPTLGIIECNGNCANNIVLNPGPNDGPSIAYDPDDPEHPYKMVMFQKGKRPEDKWGETWGLHGFVSGDGLNWHPTDPPVILKAGDRTNIMFTKPAGKFICYTRHKDMFAHVGCRAIYRSDSGDFLHWTEPQLVLAPDLGDEPDVEFYGMSVFERNGWFFGLLEYWKSSIDTIEVHLVYSKDGINWKRPFPRTAFIAPCTEWNKTWSTCASNGPIIVNEQMVFYFGGRWTAHHYDSAQQFGAIGYASLPLDRFCAIEAAALGSFTTVPIVWPGGDLVLNADTRESFSSHPAMCDGEIQVEALDESLQPIEQLPGKAVFQGNTHSRCGIHDGTVRWPGAKSLDCMRGKAVVLRFTMRHARLFTITAAL
ncbi:MAG: sialidase family protein [Armatimonadota bacterium]|nr:sialidase family protein [Armatimonadota bacterium]